MSHDTRHARARQIRSVAWGLLLMLTGDAVAAQSLGALAREEQARRKGVSVPGKVYTNDKLRADPNSRGTAPTAPPSVAPPATAAPSDGGKPGGAPQSTQPAQPTQPAPAPPGASTQGPAGTRDEAYWRDRLKALRETAQRNRVFIDALQSRVNGLTADFTARDDPSQRAAIAVDRERALAELSRLKTEIQQQDKAIGDAQEEGRRAGVPSGWLR